MPILVVGLGPGPYELVTLAASRVLESAAVVRLRTARHPTVESFPASIHWTSFDSLYDSLPDFDQVYVAIVEALLSEARDGSTVVYAVPGDPSFGEAAVALLRSRASTEGIEVEILPGLSFVGPTLQALDSVRIDNLQIVDALQPPEVDPTVPLLAYQVYSPSVAAEFKIDLLKRYPADHPVFVVRNAGNGSEQSVRSVPLAELERRATFDHLTSVFVPQLEPVRAIGSVQGLRAIVTRLRGPEGCPWDREQTHRSVRKYVIEEAYEVADAIDDGDPTELKEELGDLLLQVLLHAQIADDEGEFDLDDVVRRLSEKLVGRHPHVFGDVTARTSADVIRNWEALKRAEKGETKGPKSVLDGIPRSMPALITAQETFRRAAEAGEGWLPDDESWKRASTTLARLRVNAARALDEQDVGEVGELLALIAAVTATSDLDAESALTAATQRFTIAYRQRELLRTSAMAEGAPGSR